MIFFSGIQVLHYLLSSDYDFRRRAFLSSASLGKNPDLAHQFHGIGTFFYSRTFDLFQIIANSRRCPVIDFVSHGRTHFGKLDREKWRSIFVPIFEKCGYRTTNRSRTQWKKVYYPQAL